MPKHHNARGEQRSISRRLTKVEHAISEMKKTVPMPPEQRVNMEAAMAREARPGERPDYYRYTRGNADHETPVRERMAALKGQSRSDLRSDAERGASSPLGHGKTKKTTQEMKDGKRAE